MDFGDYEHRKRGTICRGGGAHYQFIAFFERSECQIGCHKDRVTGTIALSLELTRMF